MGAEKFSVWHFFKFNIFIEEEINYFPLYNLYPTAYCYSITILMANVQRSYTPEFHWVKPLWIGFAVLHTQGQIVLIPYLFLWLGVISTCTASSSELLYCRWDSQKDAYPIINLFKSRINCNLSRRCLKYASLTPFLNVLTITSFSNITLSGFWALY